MKFPVRVGFLILASLCLAPFAIGQQSNHVDDELFADALKPFHILANATDIGVNLTDYRRLLVDAKTDFDTPISKFPDPSVQRTQLQEAMQDYIIAVDVWTVSIENIETCKAAGVPMKTDFYRLLRARIGEDILPAPKAGRCVRQENLLKIMWLSAAQHLTRAMNAQKETAH